MYTEALLALAARSRTGFNAMMAQTSLDCDFSATGKLVLYADAAAFAGAQRQMLLQRALGSVQHAVTAAQCLAIEHLQREITHLAPAHREALLGCELHRPLLRHLPDNGCRQQLLLDSIEFKRI